jgi:hypothetical protein
LRWALDALRLPPQPTGEADADDDEQATTIVSDSAA